MEAQLDEKLGSPAPARGPNDGTVRSPGRWSTSAGTDDTGPRVTA
jgi:hypothetical protein